MPGEHAKLAPSAGGRWTLCAGSVQLIESLPQEQQDKPNKDAMWGTACHEVLARSLLEKRTPASFVGETIIVSGKAEEAAFSMAERSFRITQEDAHNVGIAYSYVMGRITELARMDESTQVLVEERLDCGSNFHRVVFNPDTMQMEPTSAPLDTCWGTGDIVLLGGGYIEVIDYKNGQRWVQHIENIQLLLYLLGAIKHVPRDRAMQRARLTIIQPRAVVAAAPEGDPLRDAVRSWEFPIDKSRSPEFDGKDLMDWALELGEAAWKTREANAPLVPGDHCRSTFCPAQAICPALQGAAVTALQGEQRQEQPSIEVLQNPNPSIAGADLVPAADMNTDLVAALAMTPDQMNLEQLARILDAREMIRSWLSSVEEHCHQRMMKGETVPGFKLVMGRRSREWGLTEEELLKKLGNMNRIGEDGKSAGKLQKTVYTVTSVISPAQAEKRVKPMVTERTWKNIEALINVKEGKPTIASATDSRAEVKIHTGEEVFGLDKPAADAPDFDFLK